MTVPELLKKLEAQKSNKDKGKTYLKHLSPLHNPKAAKDNEIVSSTLINNRFRDDLIKYLNMYLR